MPSGHKLNYGKVAAKNHFLKILEKLLLSVKLIHKLVLIYAFKDVTCLTLTSSAK